MDYYRHWFGFYHHRRPFIYVLLKFTCAKLRNIKQYWYYLGAHIFFLSLIIHCFIVRLISWRYITGEDFENGWGILERGRNGSQTLDVDVRLRVYVYDRILIFGGQPVLFTYPFYLIQRTRFPLRKPSALAFLGCLKKKFYRYLLNGMLPYIRQTRHQALPTGTLTSL